MKADVYISEVVGYIYYDILMNGEYYMTIRVDSDKLISSFKILDGYDVYIDDYRIVTPLDEILKNIQLDLNIITPHIPRATDVVFYIAKKDY